jgi:hypothetical protein
LWRISATDAGLTKRFRHALATMLHRSHFTLSSIFYQQEALVAFPRNPIRRSRRGLLFLRFGQIVHVKDHSDHETAAGTHSNLFAVTQIIDGDLEAVAAWARVCVCLEGGIVGHVLLNRKNVSEKRFAT